ncbi:hypothetical protein GCM10009636_31550 [Arthrobacter koreensis]
MLLGPGDDAAVVAAPHGRSVLSIVTLVQDQDQDQDPDQDQDQDQDSRLQWPGGYRSTGYDVGWKCAAENLSDINAMGAVATSLVVSLTLPGEAPVSWVEGLADGLSAALRALVAGNCNVAAWAKHPASESIWIRRVCARKQRCWQQPQRHWEPIRCPGSWAGEKTTVSWPLSLRARSFRADSGGLALRVPRGTASAW